MNLPPEFVRNIEGVHGRAGRQFLTNLPQLIEEASQAWGLFDIQVVPTLSFNFVAFARRNEEQVILKMGVPNREFKSEMATLRLFNGNGACRLLEHNKKRYWMLLERLNPGAMLATLEDDEAATQVAVELMLKIWRPVEAGSRSPDTFLRLTDWFAGLRHLRRMFKGGTGPLDQTLVQRVETSVKDFFAENHKPVLMHGDFHHYNILSSERGWLVIDPKGVLGPACYEVGPLLINPVGNLLSRSDYRGITRRRIDILHEHLGFERDRIREWGLAHAILSAWWSIEDHGDWRDAAHFAEMIAGLELN